MLLAIESSCDETAVAILDIKRPLAECDNVEDFLRGEIVSSQMKLHQAYGGVVPELAAREHLQSLPALLKEVLEVSRIRIDEIQAVAVTSGPGLKGCLLVGLAFAKSFAYSRRLPLVPVNHLEGHLSAGMLLPSLERPQYPMLALLVSGGHTELVFVRQFGEYQCVARTKDDAVGEAFDKCATLLKLPYPGGPVLAMAAARGDGSRFQFPVGMPHDETAFSFSGMKTAVSRAVQALGDAIADEQTKCDIAAGVENALIRALVEKSLKAVKKYRPRSFLLSGGVAANEKLRSTLSQELQKRNICFAVPPKRWCTDNAAMIGVVAARRIEENYDRYQLWWKSLSPGLGVDVPFDVGVRPRWPVTDKS